MACTLCQVHVRAPDASAEVRDVGRSVHTYEGSTEAGQHPYFGELALQYKGTTRAATVIATRDTSLWAISRKIFKCVAIRMTTRKELVGSLKRVEILNKLGATQLQHLADVVSDARFSEGEKVITEGDVGNEMFVVHEVQLLKNNVVSLASFACCDDACVCSGYCCGDKAH
jgi:cAMP-dependent protein kinase regulator